MVASVALHEENTFENAAIAQTRGEVIARYRQLRAISKQHHSNVLKFVSGDAMMRHARRLGLVQGGTLVLDDIEEMHLAFDLAIHTPKRAARARSTAMPDRRNWLRVPTRRWCSKPCAVRVSRLFASSAVTRPPA